MSEKKIKKSGSNLNFLFIVGLVLAIIMIIFTYQNDRPTTVEFFTAEINPPLALLIVVCIAIGAILALLFSIPGWRRRRKKRIHLQDELKTLRKHYEELAAINKPKVDNG